MRLLVFLILTSLSFSFDIVPNPITANSDVNGSVSINSTGKSTWNAIVTNKISALSNGSGLSLANQSGTTLAILDPLVNHLGIGVVPDPDLNSSYVGIQFPNLSINAGALPGQADAYLHYNAIRENADTFYDANGFAARLIFNNGSFIFDNAASGTAGASVPFSRRVVLNDSGNLGVGISSPQRKLHVSDGLRLEPQASPPASAANGDMYLDSDGNQALCVYLNGSWVVAAGTGTCG